MDQLSIKVNIAGRSYPLTIERSEEEMIRKAADNINESVKNLKENYAVKDIQDLLAMAALQLSTKSNTISKEVDDDKVANELKTLDKELSDFLEK
jgi:cell division protein ZapA (FtsZ GTPase activity inhibitor)